MSRAVFQLFERYQKERTAFVQGVAELALRPQNIDDLQNLGVMNLLRPFLLDTVPANSQTAALALGRLANYSETLAEAVVANEVLPQLVFQLSEKNRYYKKTAAFVLKSVAKHSPQLAQAVVDANALDALVGCLSEFEPSVREAAAWALGYIARHTSDLAQAVVDAGAIPLLVTCLREPELALKRISVATLSDICKHSAELAQLVWDAGALPYLAGMLQVPDAKLKRNVCACLAQIAKHTVDLAELVVEAEVFPKIFVLLKDKDATVRRNTATCVREVVKHTPELAQMVVDKAHGLSALVDYVKETKGAAVLPGIMALGYIASFSERLADNVKKALGILPIRDALINESDPLIKSASAWALGQIGRHTMLLAQAIAEDDCLRHLVATYQKSDSPDLKKKAQIALKLIIQKCTHLPALEPLLHDAPEKILRYVVHQFAKVLPNNASARRSFVQTKGLARIQQLKAEDKSGKLQEYIALINGCFPEAVVNFYTPNYAQLLMKQLDDDPMQQQQQQQLMSSSSSSSSLSSISSSSLASFSSSSVMSQFSS
eukprot:TRINITY_DN279_c0_g7_i1.p1 TRINITY_DN279_c0_g7~~TRINITY_DN279_c0_g7_i1.p1  ORF type:complete len:562 (-),score=148.26 TRINITY_DN279_c0_g7_i1:138-1778(-)